MKKNRIIKCMLIISLLVFNISNVYATKKTFSGQTTTVCGFEYMSDRLPNFTSKLYDIIKLMVPIILIIMGMIDFTKAMMANEEKKMKDAQKHFITRLLAAIIIFFVLAIVKFVFKTIDSTSDYKNGFINCVDCLLGGDGWACKTESTHLHKGEKKCSDYSVGECPVKDADGDSCGVFLGKCNKQCVTYSNRMSKCIEANYCDWYGYYDAYTNDNDFGLCDIWCKALSKEECSKYSSCKWDNSQKSCTTESSNPNSIKTNTYSSK